jgi:hypothetical protein
MHIEQDRQSIGLAAMACGILQLLNVMSLEFNLLIVNLMPCPLHGFTIGQLIVEIFDNVTSMAFRNTRDLHVGTTWFPTFFNWRNLGTHRQVPFQNLGW